MKILTSGFAVFGAFVALLWIAGTLGIGEFRLSYGPHQAASRWEQYRNIPSQEAETVIDAATKDGADCHALPAAKITVCRWP